MNSRVLQPEDAERQIELIAPLWHTFLVLALLLLASASSAYLHGWRYVATHLKIHRYVIFLLWQWMTFVFVCWGFHKRGIHLSELIGGSWTKMRFLRDLGIAVGFLMGSYILLVPLALLLKPSHSANVAILIPHGRAEILLYLLVACSAGFIEEIIFRGYMLRQFAAVSNSTIIGLILQGVIFGASHGYQGAKRMLILGVWGCLIGSLAVWRRSLRPGMIAHALQDVLFGVVASSVRR